MYSIMFVSEDPFPMNQLEKHENDQFKVDERKSRGLKITGWNRWMLVKVPSTIGHIDPMPSDGST